MSLIKVIKEHFKVLFQKPKKGKYLYLINNFIMDKNPECIICGSEKNINIIKLSNDRFMANICLKCLKNQEFSYIRFFNKKNKDRIKCIGIYN